MTWGFIELQNSYASVVDAGIVEHVRVYSDSEPFDHPRWFTVDVLRVVDLVNMFRSYQTKPNRIQLNRVQSTQMRELINDFACSRYKSCLSYLANLKGDLQLDLHLHMHLDRLYKMVEDKCLMQ